MRNNEFGSVEEAEISLAELNTEIQKILDRDLGPLAREDRSIGRWYSLLGKDPEYSNTAEQLDLLHNLLIDAEKYISKYRR